MTEDDTLYYQQRAEAELTLAEQTTLPEVVRVHCQLADAYLDRIALHQPGR